MATTIEHGARDATWVERERAFDAVWDSPKGWLGPIRTVNNIPVARRYMIAGFTFFVIGGMMALLMRLQLGTPENTFLDAETYNQIFTMHGTTMMFLFVIPFIEAVANYLLPLQLGTRDLPFPRLTALSFWTYVFGGAFIYSSFLWGLAPDGGWFAYVPLNDRYHAPGLNMDFWDIGLSVAEVAAMGAAAELIVAILRMRAPGMRLGRMPLFVWAMLVTGFMIIFGFTPLIVGTAMLELDRKGLTSFFIPGVGGEPILWQHLFWVFGHPEVYIMFVPAAGIVAQIVQVFSRRPIVSYSLQVLAMIATGFLSFGLWVHHMFAVGLSMAAMSFFTAASMVIAIPNGIQFIGWIATLWSGRPVFRAPLLFVLGAMVIFLLGGVTGVMLGSVPFDEQAHDSYFVVAHFHYVLIGGVIFPLVAGLYYWLPKITGRMLNERLAKWNFWLMFLFFNVAFFPMHISGLLGMPRRVFTYAPDLGWDTTNLISTIGAFGFALGVSLLLVNLVWSLRRGPAAGNDPWHADTLEWSERSPPPNAQFRFIPVVRARHTLWQQESIDARGTEHESLLEPLQNGPTRWRGALVVDVVDATPRAIAHIPGPDGAPFTVAVGFVFLFAGALLDSLLPLAIGAVLALVGAVAWFIPQKSQETAIEELGTEPREGRLPLTLAGPSSNGYWGTVVLLLILVTAFATVVASYYYIGADKPAWPPVTEFPRDPITIVTLPLVAAGLLLVSGALLWWLRRAVRDDEVGATRVSLALASLASAAFIAVTIIAFARFGLSTVDSAYASALVLVLGFTWLVQGLLVAMLVAAQIWTWRRPLDRRGDGVAINASMVGFLALATGLLALAVVFLTPRLW